MIVTRIPARRPRSHEAPSDGAGSGARQWRRGGAPGGAAPYVTGGGTPRKRSGRADRKACPKEVSQTSWRLPALHLLASARKEKGRAGPAPQSRAAERWLG